MRAMVLAPLGGGSAAGASGYSLARFAIPQQQAGKWCWSAVAVGVADFYGGASWTQCGLAGTVLGASCCASPVPGPCDVDNSLDASLSAVNHFVRREDKRAAFTAVQSEVSADRPMGARIVWAGGGGAHFVALGGWRIMADGSEFVEVHDPLTTMSVSLPYSKFVSGYRSPGDLWKNSYFTHPSPVPTGGGALAGAPTNA